MKNLPPLILASQSPRRKQLLEALGLNFQVLTPDIDEGNPEAKSIGEAVKDIALRKALAVSSKVEKSTVVIAADTLVVLGDKVLAKPQDKKEAIQMLDSLSGNRHRVVTGMALVSAEFGRSVILDESFVTFRKMSEAEIEDYASTREPYDKAGAYAVQGLGAIFISGIEGSYTNVMGFPVERFLIELPRLTKTRPFDWF